ncbi:MAG: response regulator [Defluviitaleaceae bacterium]|nr:response regulator [Defluviitaleaceae bacterium]
MNENKNSILIVDDDTSNLMELSHILRSDYKIYAVKDGANAIIKAKESLPDLILLDVIMPGMDGFDVLVELKSDKRTAEIPVIFITGMQTNDKESEGLSIGAMDYIRKPFDTKVVKLRVSNQLKIVNLQRELQNAVKMAEAANKSKSNFLASMSHEIRTPMNAIMGITNILLQKPQLPKDTIDALGKINSSSNLLLDIINDVLDLTKIETGKMDIAQEEYDLERLLIDVININTPRLKNKPVKFILEVDEFIPAMPVGDATRIKQVLNNLLSNAFKYTHSGEVTMDIAYEPKNDGVMMEFNIIDTGVGIDHEQLKILFEDYARFTTELGGVTVEGTGLGLPITKKLASLMNAELSVESTPNVGSKFTVRLPQKTINDKILGAEAAENLRTDRLPKDPSIGFVRKKMPNASVLVVDDVEINLYVTEGILEPYELKVDMAANGLEAIEKIEAGNTYDLIFMDYMMPQMNGLEATTLLREKGYTAPIVALTANAITDKAEMFLQNGFDGYITKPIDIKEVDNVLNKFLNSHISH